MVRAAFGQTIALTLVTVCCGGSTIEQEPMLDEWCERLCAKFVEYDCQTPELDGYNPYYNTSSHRGTPNCMALCLPKAPNLADAHAGLARCAATAKFDCHTGQDDLVIEGCDDEARAVTDAHGICMTFPSGDQGPCTGETPTRYYCAQTSSHEYAPNLNANCKDIGGGEFCCVEPYLFEPKP